MMLMKTTRVAMAMIGLGGLLGYTAGVCKDVAVVSAAAAKPPVSLSRRDP